MVKQSLKRLYEIVVRCALAFGKLEEKTGGSFNHSLQMRLPEVGCSNFFKLHAHSNMIEFKYEQR